MKKTRRDILKWASLSAGAVAVDALSTKARTGATATPRDPSAAFAPAGGATTEVTDKSGKRLAAGPAVTWSKLGKASAANVADVVIDPGKTSQTVLGFGAAFTDASCYTVSRLAPDDRANLLTQMFGQGADQGCLSTGRIPLGSSDYATACYSYDDGMADPDMKRFSIDHDRDYIIPTLKTAADSESRHFLLRLSLEPSRLDEVFELHARRKYSPGEYSGLRPLHAQVRRKLR